MRIRGRSTIVAVLALGLLALVPAARAADEPTPYPEGRWQPPAPAFGEYKEVGRRVRASDGAVLVVDVTYPADPQSGQRLPGPFPVILNQDLYSGSLLYGRAVPTSSTPPPPNYFVQRGFIFVHSHDRGTGGSQGAVDTSFGTRVGQDGVELAYWAADPANVPGSGGIVGLEGCSALGIVQLSTLSRLGELQGDGAEVLVPGANPDLPGRLVPATAATNPIRAAIPQCHALSQYREQFTDNGVPTTIFGLSLVSPVAGAAIFGTSTDNLLSNFEPTSYSVDMLLHGDRGYDRQFWQDRDWLRHADDIARTGVPVLQWVGYYETGFVAAQQLYAALQNAAVGRPLTAPMVAGQPTSPKYRAIIGDWGHGGGLDKGVELEWFDTWMRGIDTGLQSAVGSLLLKEMPNTATGRWIAPQTYPQTTEYQPHYLGAGGTLSGAPAATETAVPIAWGAGPEVAYTVSQAQPVDTTILGPTTAELWVTSSTKNAQLYVELQDVGPDGSTTTITHGSILASRSKLDPTRTWTSPNGLPIRPWLTLDADRYVQPNTPVLLTVPLQPVTWRLLAGHHLRLSLAPNPGSHCVPDGSLAAGPIPYGCLLSPELIGSLAGGVVQVLQGGAHASRLSAALVPSDSIPTIRSGQTPSGNGSGMPLDW
jgi:predicted acyl esterase